MDPISILEETIKKMRRTISRLEDSMSKLNGTRLKLKDKINEAHNSPISVDTIITRVAEYYNLKSHDLTGTKRTKSIVMARQIAMYLSRKETRLSTTQIGAYFGGKEHGTVMHATKKIGDMIDTVQETKKDIELILKKLQ